MSKILVYDPEGSAKKIDALSLSPVRANWNGTTIGILDNRKQHAGELMEMIARDFAGRFKNVKIVKESKESAAVPMTPEQLARMARQCDLVLTGTGD